MFTLIYIIGVLFNAYICYLLYKFLITTDYINVDIIKDEDDVRLFTGASILVSGLSWITWLIISLILIYANIKFRK